MCECLGHLSLKESKMLKDRRVLLEAEITRLKDECGHIYLSLVTNEDPAGILRKVYESKLGRLTNMSTELLIVSDMISKGHP
jgi:hypothetical protein